MENVLTFEIEADELEIFLQDVNEHLDTMEAGILRLERAADPDTLNATFRAAHTLKAVAATVGHHQMAELTHTLETLFDAMREGQLSPAQKVIDALLTTVDALGTLRDEVITGQPSDADVDALLARLRALTSDSRSGRYGDSPSRDQHSWLTSEQAIQVQDYGSRGYTILEIEVTTRAEAFAPGARLLQAAVALAGSGHVIAQRPSQDDLTEGQHSGHLWLFLATQSDPHTVEETLSHIPDLAQFYVQPYFHEFCGVPASPPELANESEDKPDDFYELPQSPTSAQLATSDTIRINIEHLDTLMNLVGELVTDRTRLIQVQDMLRVQYGKNGVVGALSDMATHFDRVVDQLQQEVMQARMLPISRLFTKFPRLVRDVARAADKQVNLVIEGEATELDRSVIEVIGDPLIHLLRNAVDHGIEPPEERIAVGKPPTGTIWLTAAHEEGHIVVAVKDDGQGINPERIRQAAVSRGLLSEEELAQIDDDAVVNLIFQPNLSTSSEITGVSGRGVGLDVVRTNVKQLSGSVVVESVVGRGTTFRVTLPLTLAIVQAMMVSLGDDVYAIPLTSIVESLYLSDVDISSVKGKPVIQWRDQVLPIVHMRGFFAHHRLTARSADEDKQAVVTVAWGRLKAGLIVDSLLGKQEIVIKSLGTFIGNVPGLSGCTILGDGRIALIIDVPGLISTTMKKANTLSVAGF
jgi:two-component system chemotaxis sensor kinase CheA